MPKANLSDTWIYAGKTYLPGVHEDMPQEVYDALKGKGALTGVDAPTVRAPAAPEPPDRLDAAADLIDRLGVEVGTQLALAGFPSVEAVQAASDEDLLAVKGIGPATLRSIRAALQE